MTLQEQSIDIAIYQEIEGSGMHEGALLTRPSASLKKATPRDSNQDQCNNNSIIAQIPLHSSDWRIDAMK